MGWRCELPTRVRGYGTLDLGIYVREASNKCSARLEAVDSTWNKLRESERHPCGAVTMQPFTSGTCDCRDVSFPLPAS